MSNIILVGMPACGKSTIGVVLAKTINKGFVDTDLLIQQKENRTLQQIINEEGNDYFCNAEESVLLDFDGTNYVVATGGSAIYYPSAIENFKKNGTVVYLQVGLDSILSRLNNITTRGVTLAEGQTIEDLYNERIPLYEQRCDICVNTDGLNVEETVEKIINALAM